MTNLKIKILIFSAICFLSLVLNSCETSEKNFSIKGNLECVKSEYLVLYKNNITDTVKVKNNEIFIEGKIDTVQMVYIKNPDNNKKYKFILEPGQIKISCDSLGLIATGTPTNNSFLEYNRGMDLATDKVMALYQVYHAQDTDEDKKMAMTNYNKSEEERLAFMRKQLRDNPNLTGLQILKPIYRTDSIQNLSGYLSLLKKYSNSEIYQEVFEYNKAVASASPGKNAPEIELLDLKGNFISLEQFKGNYILLDFWFTGCGYCDQLVPHLKQIYKDYHDKGFEIIDISVDKDEQDWRKTAAKKNSPWIHLHDPVKKVASKYGMPGYPILILIDREGKVLKRLVGYRNESDLRKEILSVMKF